MERETTIEQAWDCILLPSPDCKRHDDCDPGIPSKNYGRGGIRIKHILKITDDLTVQFMWSPGVYLPETQKIMFTWEASVREPMAWDLGWHHRYIDPPKGTKKNEWGWVDADWPYYGTVFDECDYNEGGCYYDGSSLNAEPVLELLIREGDEAMWAELESYGQSLLPQQVSA